MAETVASPLSATPMEGGRWVRGTRTPQETLRLAGQGTHRAEGREGEDTWRIWHLTAMVLLNYFGLTFCLVVF